MPHLSGETTKTEVVIHFLDTGVSFGIYDFV